MTNIYVHFSELVAPGSATDGFNYSINGGAVSVRSAKLTGDGSTVLLATDPLMPDTDYTVVVTGVYDRAFNPNLIGTPNAATLRSWVFSPGFLVAELFLGITGNAIGDLTANPRYPDLADTNFFVADGQSPTALAENYGGHLVGYLVPPVSGTYTFYIRGDDGTELRLGTSADPASLVTVAAVTAANQPFTSGASPAQTLVGGQPYLIEGLWKEGTGGDYVQIGWMPPWDPNITIIPCAYLATYADAAGASVTITNQPRNQTGYQLRTVTLTVGAAGTPAENPLCYQWQRADGLGGFTNVSGANGPAYTTPPLQFPGDDGAVFRAVVRAPGGVVATSEEAVIAVVVDNDPPVLLSAMSLDGSSIDLCYSEHLETNDLGSGPVALDTFGYQVNGGAVGILRAEWAVDYSSVILFLDGSVQSGFTVTISPDDLPIRDLAGNVIQTSQTVTGMVAGLTALDVGNPADPVEAGLTFLCGSDRIVMRGGGSDIWSTNDHCQFVFREMEGDFDVRARVESLEQINVWSKVGIMARVSTNANSRNATMLVTPPGGQNTYTFQWRATTEGASISSHRGNGGPVFDPTYPNAWLRLRRAGAVLTGFYSSNGLDWLVQASHDSSTSAEGALPSTLLVGLAITSHDNGAGRATEAVIHDLSFAAVTVPPEFSRIEYQDGNVLLEFPTQAGASYTIEYKVNLNDASWQTLTTVPGTGGLAQSIDPNPAEQSRFYRLRAD
jgi:hypothetical protein